MVPLLLALTSFGAAPPARPTAEWLEKARKAVEVYRKVASGASFGLMGPDRLIAGLREAVAAEHEAHGRYNRNAPKHLKWIADLQEAHRRWDEAIASRREVLEINERLYGPKHWRTSDARFRLEETRRARTRTPEQLRKVSESLQLAGLSRGAFDEGDFAKALKLMERAVLLCKEAKGENHPDHGTLLNNLALIHFHLGDRERGLPILRRALAIRRAGMGENHPDYAQSLYNLGKILAQFGHMREAMPMLQRAVAISDEAGKEGRYEYGMFLSALATAYFHLGDLKSAVPILREAVQVLEATRGEVDPLTAEVVGSLGVALGMSGRTEEALPLLRRSLAVTRRTRGTRHPEYATCLNNLAMLLDKAKRYDEAIRLAEEGVALRKKWSGERHPDYAIALSNLAGFHFDRNDLRAAGPLLRRSLDVTRGAFGERHRYFASGLDMLGAYYHRDSRPLEALVAADRAVRLRQEIAAESFLVLSERGQLDVLEGLRLALHLRLSLPGDAPSASYAHVLNWKGAVFSFQQRRRLFRQAAGRDAETARVAGDLEETTRRLAALSFRAAVPERELRDLTARKERLEGELARRSEAFVRLASPVTPAALLEALPANAALVDFVVYLHHNDPSSESTSLYTPRIAAWVVPSRSPDRSSRPGAGQSHHRGPGRLEQRSRQGRIGRGEGCSPQGTPVAAGGKAPGRGGTGPDLAGTTPWAWSRSGPCRDRARGRISSKRCRWPWCRSRPCWLAMPGLRKGRVPCSWWET